MQSVEVKGLDKVLAGFEALPDELRKVRADAFDAAGRTLLSSVQEQIGGTGRIAGAQTYRVGSGKGYVAVAAAPNTELDGYAAGYVTNALENGHTIRRPSGNAKRKRASRAKMANVPGKHMYRTVEESSTGQVAEQVAAAIERAAQVVLNGGK